MALILFKAVSKEKKKQQRGGEENKFKASPPSG